MQAEGEKFKFDTVENREQAEIDRASNQLDQMNQQINDAQNAITQGQVGDALA
jgi:anion-transporting  ArsA/GET3 family ATPase